MSMSTDEDSVGSPLKPATPTEERAGKPKVADILRQQQSFEARYSSIIQRQIWETSINKDVLERQLNAYFPFARSASLTKDGSGGFDQLLKPKAASGSDLKSHSVGTTPTKRMPASGKPEQAEQEANQREGLEKTLP